MEVENSKDVKIGHWCTMCCQRDMYQIVNEVQLEEARILLSEYDTFEVYDNKIEFITVIRDRWESQDEIDNCNDMIADCESQASIDAWHNCESSEINTI